MYEFWLEDPVLNCKVNNSSLEKLVVQTVLSDWEFIINKSFVVEILQKCVSNPLACLDLQLYGLYVVVCFLSTGTNFI